MPEYVERGPGRPPSGKVRSGGLLVSREVIEAKKRDGRTYDQLLRVALGL